MSRLLNINGVTIETRDDGYINATQLCKAGKKLFGSWNSRKGSRALIKKLSETTNIDPKKLVEASVGGLKIGTWVHPEIGMELAHWIHPSFPDAIREWRGDLQREVIAEKSRTVSIDGVVIQSRSDCYINATQLCRAGRKLFHDWNRLDTTQELYAELSKDTGIPVQDLIDTKIGGTLQGAWIHPDLAVQLAQWISPSFSIQVSRWVRELFICGSVSVNVRRDDNELKQMELKCAELEDLCIQERDAKQRAEDAKQRAEDALKTAQINQLRLREFIKTTTKLEQNEILYIGTTDLYQNQNHFKVGGVISEDALAGRFSSYNSGRPADDRFYCVRFWKVHSYGVLEKILKSVLVHFKDHQSKSSEDYHIHGDSLVEMIEYAVRNDDDSVEWINEHLEPFTQRTIEAAPSKMAPLILKKRLSITAGDQKFDICDITSWTQEEIDAEITAIIEIYKQRKSIAKLNNELVPWREFAEIIKERHKGTLMAPWRQVFKEALPRRSERLRLKGLGAAVT